MQEHIVFDQPSMRLRLLDQRALPGNVQYFDCSNYKDAIYAIQNMVVRGAPAIGVAAAYACVLAAYELRNDAEWRPKLAESLTRIATARPTAVNLAWAVQRMRRLLAEHNSPESLLPMWIKEAIAIHNEDIAACQSMGRFGAELIKDGDCVLTHCNAGALATGGYGTALGVLRAAAEMGKKFTVIADETRPLLQGSRLTAYELHADGIKVKIACDNACGLLMQKKMVQLVITGADRIAANGDAANKIGTLGVAVLANYFKIPFYIAAPVSTIDAAIASGEDIPIEQRAESEVLCVNGHAIGPQDVGAYNFAFDVTPAKLIAGIITEKGLLRPPYGESIAKIFS